MIALENTTLSLYPWDWQCNDSSTSIVISLAEFLSPGVVNAYAKPLKQKLFEALWWYVVGGAWIPYTVSPVSFVFQTVTGNIGCVIPYWPPILVWNSLL